MTENMNKYIVLFTDGYKITQTSYDTKAEASDAIKNEYKSYDTNEPCDEFDEMSECHENGAILYNHGEDVYIWTTLNVTKPAYFLTMTDGYSIKTLGTYNTREEAAAALKNEYNSTNRNDSDSEWAKESYCEELEAMLYNNGEDVYCYKIIFAPLFTIDKNLSPCPFCGNPPQLTLLPQDSNTWKNDTYWRISCSDQFCIAGAYFKNRFVTKDAAIEAWETRPTTKNNT